MGETEDAAAMAGDDTMDIDSPPPAIPPGPLTEASSSSEPTSTAAATTTTNTDPPLSKNARKKLLKEQTLQETHESWKARKREKRKARKAALRERQKRPASPDEGEGEGEGEGMGEGEGEVGGSSSAAGAPAAAPAVPAAKRARRPVLEPITIILDCAFDDLMADKEIISLSSQLTRCYSVNRASPRQFSLQITSLNGRLLDRYEKTLASQHLRWKKVTCTASPYEVTEDLIYLTADSPNTITELEHGKKYVIGGIVDKNRHKMLCYNKAVEQGIQTAKLPIGEYVKMASRFVLTTNQVVEIMVKWLECKDWKRAFMEVIPQRKMPEAKAGGGSADQDQADGEEPEDGTDRSRAPEGGDGALAQINPAVRAPEPNTTQGSGAGGEDKDMEDGGDTPAEGGVFKGTITIHSFVPPPLRL